MARKHVKRKGNEEVGRTFSVASVVIPLVALCFTGWMALQNTWMVGMMRRELDLRTRPIIGNIILASSFNAEGELEVRAKVHNVGVTPANDVTFLFSFFLDGKRVGSRGGEDYPDRLVIMPNQDMWTDLLHLSGNVFEAAKGEKRELSYEIEVKYSDLERVRNYYYKQRGGYEFESNEWALWEAEAN